MWPDSVFAAPVSSFGAPVPAPTRDPGDTPTSTITVNCDWLPYIRGALFQLVLQTTWKTDLIPLTVTQMRAMSLIASISECASPTPPFACPYDFAGGAGAGSPWVPSQRGDLVAPWASFVPTVGFNTVSSSEPGSGHFWECATIQLSVPDTVGIDIISCSFAGVTKGSSFASGLHDNPTGIYTLDGGSLINSNFVPADSVPDGDSIMFLDNHGAPITSINVSLLVGVTDSSPADGLGIIAGVIVTGHALAFDCANPTG